MSWLLLKDMHVLTVADVIAINIYIKASFQQLVVCIQCGFVVASGYVHCTITIAVSHSKYNCDKTVYYL